MKLHFADIEKHKSVLNRKPVTLEGIAAQLVQWRSGRLLGEGVYFGRDAVTDRSKSDIEAMVRDCFSIGAQESVSIVRNAAFVIAYFNIIGRHEYHPRFRKVFSDDELDLIFLHSGSAMMDEKGRIDTIIILSKTLNIVMNANDWADGPCIENLDSVTQEDWCMKPEMLLERLVRSDPVGTIVVD